MKSRIGNAYEAIKFLERHRIKKYKLAVNVFFGKIEVTVYDTKVSVIRKCRMKEDLKLNRMVGIEVILKFEFG